jgi:N-acetylglucosamine kinase-like BadF-type ATPase
VHFPGRDPVADEAEALAETLSAIFEIATAELGLRLPLHGICAAVAGAGRVEERKALAGALLRRGVARTVRVVSDLEAALHDAFGRGPGIVLLAGTGSVGVGRDRRGRFHRVGGWGELLGDEGSGYEIGLRGLRAAIRGEEGRAPATRLGPPLMRAVGVNRFEELIGWSRGVRKAEVAGLAPIVLETAEDGDEVAAAVVGQAVEGLLAHVAALSRTFSTESGERGVGVALGGGLLDPGAPMRDRVAAGVRSRGLEVESRFVDGARGALGLAMELLGDQDSFS